MHAPSSATTARAILFTIAFLMTCAQTATAQRLPARAFDIEGGSVQMQGGLLATKQRVSLFMELTNESKTAVWAEVEFQLPGTDRVSREMKVVNPGDRQVMYQMPLEQVAWDTMYPFKVSVFSDEDRKKTLGAEAAYFFFEEKHESQAFDELQEKLQPNQAAIVNGFRELTGASLAAEVKGTRAQPELRRDIAWTLFKAESRSAKDCQHYVLKAEAYEDAIRSVIAAKLGGKAQRLEEKLRSKGEMLVEKWWVQSCEAVSIYEVLLLRSPQGGTDIMVEFLESEPAPTGG